MDGLLASVLAEEGWKKQKAEQPVLVLEDELEG